MIDGYSPDIYESECDIFFFRLYKRNPHQLFIKLVSLAQEFVVEVKVRLLALLHDLSVNNLAEIFLIG